MDPVIVLLILRLAAGVLLLAFMGVLVWLLQRETQLTARALADEDGAQGMLCLLDAQGAVVQRFPLRPVTSIGRIPSNTIVLSGAFVSAEHALITRRGQQWQLEDLGSRNGTWLNQLPVTEPVVLTPGDVVTIGEAKLRLEAMIDPA